MSAPSAGRGPSRSSGRMTVATRPPRRAPALDLGHIAGPGSGAVSRPSVNACSTTSGPARARQLDAARPGGRSRRAPRPRRRGRSGAAARCAAGHRASERRVGEEAPPAIASSIRVRSWAPRRRRRGSGGPTSELPICPSGRPTARPPAVNCRVPVAGPELVERRRARQRDRVARTGGRGRSRPARRDRPTATAVRPVRRRGSSGRGGHEPREALRVEARAAHECAVPRPAAPGSLLRCPASRCRRRAPARPSAASA